MSGRQLFGVVVRTLGLVVILVGGHRVFYAFASSVLHFKSYYPPHVYLVAGLVYLVAGVALMWRAEWFVGFAYGPEP
jgi:hypothetical protein